MLPAPRIRFLYIFIAMVAIIFIGKLFFIQIMHGEDYVEQASNQYISPIAHIFDRGSIFFTKKDGGLLSGATLKSSYTVAINPTVLKDAASVFKQLLAIIPDIESDTFFLRAGKIEDPYEEVAWRISEEDVRKIQNLDILGVGAYKERWRFYPGGSQAAHVLGFVGYEGNESKGRYGLERYYEEVLQRKEGTSINLFAEVFANVKNSLLYDSKKLTAGDLVLTLEPEVQSFLEQTLQKSVDSFSAESGGALIIDPKTGAIFALAANPTFDPNNFSSEKDYSIFSNPIVESVFEMGSIVKPLTIAAAFDAGVIKTDDTYYDEGSIVLNNKTISNYDGKARGRVPIQEILNQSLNIGAVYVAQKLG
ncbi:MAG: penicillin-binding transpeptidase domain-containing protein, partial [bacterium]|nr:penicillin-binding transpeptidase domain-containing protein [bacterium]